MSEQTPENQSNAPAESGGVSSAPEIKPLDSAQNIPPVKAETQDKMANRQDWVRTAIAAVVLLTFIGLLCFAGYAIIYGGDFYARFARVAPLLITVLGTSFGAAVGYYMGGR